MNAGYEYRETIGREGSGSTVLALVTHVAYLAVPLGPLLHGGDVRADESFGWRWVAGGLVTMVVSGGLLSVLLRRGTNARQARQRDLDDAAHED